MYTEHAMRSFSFSDQKISNLRDVNDTPLVAWIENELVQIRKIKNIAGGEFVNQVLSEMLK